MATKVPKRMSVKAIFKELKGTIGVGLLTKKCVSVQPVYLGMGWGRGGQCGSNLKRHTEGYGLTFKEGKQIAKIEGIIYFSPSSS